ncbi:DNA gyrase/topoisomerase IV subunit A [Croceimicrobium sp.]|uniref:DNA gyrase/topoisomerase IV subunit A n=1 Tax=Croceimicrobium sp. TaxID=2828340 RepID=UPI003BA9873B
MTEESQDQNQENQESNPKEQAPQITRVSGMYEDYFLDYASYVILERAVPTLGDGMKPVQRRILHALKEMDDGRYHKVANVIGQTMKYHPHGDASIGDALVQLGQKELLIDAQGNWGNVLTGDSAAAPRYIEARLSKFALDIIYSPKVTEWQSSYDGRGKEPVEFPVKFPLLLAQGVEGIAVGLSTKIMPHNFNELINASIKILKNQKFDLLPDFPTGGIADFSQYNEGLRGSRIRVRARISVRDKKTLVIEEIPFNTTTGSLIDSILKANDKGKIKIRKIEDNTAEHVEILVHLPSGISPDKMIDALYAFTDCELSIAPLCCVIENDAPQFISVKEILRRNVGNTLDVLKAELEWELNELQEKWHFASLERIFIENKIYRDIEEAETWDQVIGNIRIGLEPHIGHLLREVTEEDITRLTEIRIKRISKFDKDKADALIEALEGDIEQVKHHLNNLVEYAIDWFKNIQKKYGAGRDRKTEIRIFEDIEATKVAMANVKLYANLEEGFIGTSLKKDTFICDCSDIDDIIVFLKSGEMIVSKVDQKTYVGKDIIHVAVWKKGDKRTTYNMIYRDGKKGASFMKRFQVTAITRDKHYDLTAGNTGSEVLHFTANPNGEAEKVMVHLRALQRLKKLKLEVDFADLAIKGRGAKGNTVTKYPIKKIEIKEEGVSTLAARKIWFDDTVNRLNAEGRGRLLGSFKGEDKILEITASGHYRLLGYDLSIHFEDDWQIIEKYDPERAVSAVYFDGEKQKHFVKRFIPEVPDRKELFISEHPDSQLDVVSYDLQPRIEIIYRKINGKQKDNEELVLSEFIAVKGEKAQGNQLSRDEVRKINALEPLDPPAEEEEEIEADQDNNTSNEHSDESAEITEDDGQISLGLD